VTPHVVFDHVWKKFRRGERHDSLRDLIPATARRVWRRSSADLQGDREFWALQDVSFEVGAGEALGIIGPNGAGKSTTLKLLTKILRPTRGTCAVRGRIGALIEVAAGFHPDLTGRENVYLQGAIMGMKRREIARSLDAIVEFAGVGAFIDTPVKRYSSGMNARLGFSIAAHLNPDVLIIDEVLSVGDMAFQERCVQRMLEFKEKGVAIVFVSHNLQAVNMLCQRCLFVAGRTIALGPTADVIRQYTERAHGAVPDAATDLVARHISLTRVGGDTDGVPPGAPMTLEATFEARRDFGPLTFLFRVRRSTDALTVYDAHFEADTAGAGVVHAGDQLTVRIAFRANLARGMYFVECRVLETSTMTLPSNLGPLGTFSVDEATTWDGVAHLDAEAHATVETVREGEPAARA
jgi:ABC-type polysaccharide/polyol phosphate transport system ATPase subunit